MNRLILFYAALVLMSVLCPRVLADDPGDVRPNEIRAGIGIYNANAEVPVPALSGKQIQEVLNGGVAKIRERGASVDAPQRALGYILIDHPRPAVWLAALEPDYIPVKGLTEFMTKTDSIGNSTWYQHIKLPWPVTNRHWLIDLENNTELADATRGKVWEQTWDLNPGREPEAKRIVGRGLVSGITVAEAQKSIFTPVNHGAWIAVRLRDDKTMLIYAVTSVIGGMIPESLVIRYAMSTLDELLYGIADRAEKMRTVFPNGNYPVPGGDGKPFPAGLGY